MERLHSAGRTTRRAFTCAGLGPALAILAASAHAGTIDLATLSQARPIDRPGATVTVDGFMFSPSTVHPAGISDVKPERPDHPDDTWGDLEAEAASSFSGGRGADLQSLQRLEIGGRCRDRTMNLPRFRRHPTSHESAIGVCDGETEATVVFASVQE